MGRPIFAKLPTPLVSFCPILLDPLNPQKNRTSFIDVPLKWISVPLCTHGVLTTIFTIRKFIMDPFAKSDEDKLNKVTFLPQVKFC